MKIVLFAGVATLAFSSLAWAGEAPAPDPDVAGAQAAGLSELVVTATRSPQPLERIGQSVSVIDAEAIQASQAVSLAELVATTPGASFTRNGPVGAATQLRIRGAETDQTLVVIDGVKVNDPSAPGGGFNFADILVGDVSRIEVLRGAQSTLWGSQAIGGVVNIVTAEPTSPLEGSVLAEGGSDGTAYARAAVGGAQPRFVWRLAAGRYVTDGAASAYAGGSERDGYRNTQVSGRARVILSDQASIELRSLYSDGRTDFDGFAPPTYSFADTAEYGTARDFVGYAGFNLALLEGALKNRVAYGYTRTTRDNYDPSLAVSTKTFEARGENRRVEYQGILAVTSAWTATFGAEREEATMRTATDQAEATTDSLYGQVQGDIATGLTATTGLRYDDHDAFGGHTLGQAALAWSMNDGATVLRASFGQGFKAPTLYQLFGYYGNAGLEPEEADAWDAGVQQRLADGRVRVSATWFQRQSRNLIDFFSCTTAPDPLCAPGGVLRFGYYANVAKASARGLEVTGEADAGHLIVTANYTWTDTKNRSDGANYGNELARRPKHTGNLALTYVWPHRVSTTVAVRYVGESFDDAANTAPIDAYTLVDLRASYPLSEKVELYARVENATDQRYETIRDYGAAGRTAYAGVRARF